MQVPISKPCKKVRSNREPPVATRTDVMQECLQSSACYSSLFLHIRTRLADLTRTELALASMVEECEATGCASPCQIIATIAADS